MIKGYLDFYYNVKDMKRAVKFYTEGLGLVIGYQDDYWTSLEVGNLHMGLHWNHGNEVPSTPRNSHGQEAGGTLTFSSDDIENDKNKILKAGGKMIGEVNEHFGHFVAFEDLDGNVFKIMKRPQ